MGLMKATTLIASFFALFHLSLGHTSPKDYVDAQNKVRASHGLPPLKWNNTVAAYAQKYAITRSADCKLQHSEGPFGENIAMASWDMTAAEAAKMWADEEKYYSYTSNTCEPGQMCGHYTQIVWRDSVHLGCAKVVCRNNNWTFITCNYDPPGNYIGERPY